LYWRTVAGRITQYTSPDGVKNSLYQRKRQGFPEGINKLGSFLEVNTVKDKKHR
jgi:hypothetical protein